MAGERVTTRWDPCPYMPIHQDDINEQTAALLEAATVPATIVNWGGDEAVTVQEWCAYFGELTGHDVPVDVVETPGTLRGSIADPAARQAITGPCTVRWQDGLRAASYADLEAGRERPRHRRIVGHRRGHRDRVRAVVARPWDLRAAGGPPGRGARRPCPAGRCWVVDLADLDGIDDFAGTSRRRVGWRRRAGEQRRRPEASPHRRRMTPDDVEGVMAMNYFSPVRLTLALLPGMIERGRGDIVNVSSMGVHLVAFGVGAYSASKAALELFTESLYVELARHRGARAPVRPGHHRDRVQHPEGRQRPAAPARPGRGHGRGGRRRHRRVRRQRPVRLLRDRVATPTPRRRKPPTPTRSSPR